MAEPRIDVPEESWVGDPLDLSLAGLPADRPVTLHASVRDGHERTFEATARYQTNEADPGVGTADGNADVAARAWPAVLDTFTSLTA